MSLGDIKQLKAVLDRFNTTGTIVTTQYNGQIDGCYIGFISPCSLEPLRLMVCTSHENLTHELIEKSKVLAVHIVGYDQMDWVEHFGRQSGRDVDKFHNIKWKPGITGSPILEEAIAYIEGRVINSMVTGDHTARLIEPLHAELRNEKTAPLTQFDVMTHGIDDPHIPQAFPWQELKKKD